MITVRTYPLTVALLQTVQTVLGAVPGFVYVNSAAGSPARIAFLVDPFIDAVETFEVLLLLEGHEIDVTTEGGPWQPAGCAYLPTFGMVFAFVRKSQI